MGGKIHRSNAFTLIEVIIALTIVAMLALIAILLFGGQANKGNDAKRKADINRIKIAVEEYEKDNNCYPSYVVCGINSSQPIYPYLNNVPCDPTTKVSYVYDPQGSSCPSWYRFYTKLQFTADPGVIPNIGPHSSFNYGSGSSNAPNMNSSDSPTSTPTGTASGGGENPGSQYYGCRSGACVLINWNPSRPGPECDPSFTNSNCWGQCGSPGFDCKQIIIK